MHIKTSVTNTPVISLSKKSFGMATQSQHRSYVGIPKRDQPHNQPPGNGVSVVGASELLLSLQAFVVPVAMCSKGGKLNMRTVRKSP